MEESDFSFNKNRHLFLFVLYNSFFTISCTLYNDTLKGYSILYMCLGVTSFFCLFFVLLTRNRFLICCYSTLLIRTALEKEMGSSQAVIPNKIDFEHTLNAQTYVCCAGRVWGENDEITHTTWIPSRRRVTPRRYGNCTMATAIGFGMLVVTHHGFLFSLR